MFETQRKFPLFAILAFFMLLISAEGSDGMSVYEVIESYNFPKGILPSNAKDYVLNQDGSFEVYLDKLCSFGIEAGYTLRYQSKISGNISPGHVRNLRGISVKITFLWLDISGVELVNGQLDFYVGPLYAAFPLSNFDECPICENRQTLVSSY